MRSLKIDVEARTITEVNTSTLEDWYWEIKCRCVTVAFYNEKDEGLLVDDNGLLVKQELFFQHADFPYQPFAGNGLLVGPVDDEGNTLDAVSTVEELKAKIRFLNIFQVRAMCELGAFS